jgi:DNA-damage-inducible protein D
MKHMESNSLIPFDAQSIRKIEHNGEWYFSVVDIIAVLTDSPIPRNYWNIVKKREPQLHTICMQFKLTAQDGKQRLTDCANTEGVLRIVMSVPSPKAEPLKMWLAEQGKLAIDEAENPELGFERLTEIYRAKGYNDEWIASRLKSIGIRKELTEEWQKRGVTESKDYSILTATIAKGTFGITPSEHKALKGVEKDNLRDHMTNLELVFSMLGEELSRQQSVIDDAQGFNENHDAAVKGGSMAGKFRKEAESKGYKVVSKENFLPKGDDIKELLE